MTTLIKKEDAVYFDDEELKELNDYISAGGRNIAVSTATNFLALYLEGRSIDEIHRSFPQWPKQAIQYARYTYKWDEEREKYVTIMQRKVAERLVKTKIDAIQFLQDRLAVSHKEFAQDMEKYLQNPVEANLPKNRIKSMRDYRDTIKALEELAALGKPIDQSSGGPSVTVNVNTGDKETKVEITPAEQEAVLDQLLDEKTTT